MSIDFARLSNEIGLGEPESDLPEVQEAIDSGELRECDDNGNPVEKSNLPPIEDAFNFVATELPEPAQIVKGLIHQGTKVMVGGGSKSFKTWIQLDLALSVAYGIPWMGFETDPGRVLFTNLEIQKEFFQRRILKICEARGIQQVTDRLDVWNLRGFNASYHIIIPQIIHRIKETGYRLIDLDPIYKLYGRTDENSASEVASLMNELERITVQTQAGLVFGAHYSKGNQASKEAIDRVSGSGVFTRDPDSIINFTVHEDPGSFVVEAILRNLPPIEPFVVTWNYPLMERNNDLDPSKLKQLGGRPKEHTIGGLLELIPEAGVTHKELSQISSKAGMSRATSYRLIKQAKEDGSIWYSEIKERWLVSRGA